MLEEWTLIDNIPELKPDYMISNYGNGKRINGKILHGANPKHNHGYKRFVLACKNKKIKKYPAHRLVMNHFGPYLIVSNGKEYGLDVNHNNGDKLDNRVTNLKWMTSNQNKQHAAQTGLYRTCEDHHNAIFTNDEVHKICSMLEVGIPIKDIIDAMGYSQNNNMYKAIHTIKSREYWTNISKQYIFDESNNSIKYDSDDIEDFCLLIGDGVSIKNIIKKYSDKYDGIRLRYVLKSIKNKYSHRDVSDKYFKILKCDSSTTNEKYYRIGIIE